MKPAVLLLFLSVLAPSAAVFAEDAPPAWEQLSAAQREAVLAPLRDRWNAAPPAQRQRMLAHGQRWQAMTPAQREQAQRGARRFEGMSPEQREQARALFARMRGMSPAERETLRAQWRSMNSEQRRRWVQDNPAPARP